MNKTTKPPATIGFGRYKGKTYVDILKEDPGYLEYLLKWEGLRPETKDIVEKVLAKRDYSRIPMGKFKGTRLTQETFNENKNYFMWMASDCAEKLHPNFIKLIEEYHEEYPSDTEEE